MSFIGMEPWASRAMRRIRTSVVHGKMNTIPNAIREWRSVQLAHFVLYPPSISIALCLGYLDLSNNHLRSILLLLLQSVGVIFCLETFKVHSHIFLCHG